MNRKIKEDDRNNPFHIHFVLSECTPPTKKVRRRSTVEKAHDSAKNIKHQLNVEFYRINYPGIYFNISDDEEDLR